jgi:hypothetical protein
VCECCLLFLVLLSVCVQDNLSQEVSGLKADNGELRAKLEESKQQLQSNEQMIRWLNQQVRTGPGVGSSMRHRWLGSGTLAVQNTHVN